jgi:hypothetical protein
VDNKVQSFRTIREAKDYLAGKIAEQAKREGVPLTEVERKMLHFTAAGWTLPEMMAVGAEFDRDYDQDAYERKIAGLVRGIQARQDADAEREGEAWYQAVLKLCEEDHYLLVLIGGASSAGSAVPPRWGRLAPWLPALDGLAQRPVGDLKRLILVSLAFGVVTLLILGFSSALQ